MPAGSVSGLMRAVLIYTRLHLSLMGGVGTIGERVTVADSIPRKIMARQPLTVFKAPCLFANLNRITDTSGQTCSPFEIRQLPDWISSPLCHYCLHCLGNCRGGPARPKQRWVSFHYSAPALIRYPHLKGVSCY